LVSARSVSCRVPCHWVVGLYDQRFSKPMVQPNEIDPMEYFFPVL